MGTKAVTKAVSKPKGVRVRATALGFYNNKRRRPGDEFVIKGDLAPGRNGQEPRLKEFSDAWMELVETAPKPVAQVAEPEEEDGEGDGDGESVI